MNLFWKRILCALFGHHFVMKTQRCKRCNIHFADTEEGMEI